ncbi:MAG: FAD-dependent oxidoreductase [Candidatus Pacebacteria bacterium]|nr:FAD-dependent oxidoreductase [Candidatus Paceibacterota bacterium]
MHDLIIIGGGPAACAAAVYAGRKKLSTILVTKDWGGQSIVSPGIQNWIGTVEIPGEVLAQQLKQHAYAYAGTYVTMKEGVTVEKVTGSQGAFTVTLSDTSTCAARAVLVASGARRRTLTVPGADVFEHKGVTYCATCDGPLFGGMDVVVVGGGNAGFESAAQLLAYAKSVTLLERNPSYRAEPITVEKVLAHENMRGLVNAEITEIQGDRMVTGVTYRDLASDEVHALPVQGVFVEIGTIPNTDMIKDIAERNPYGHVKVDPRTQQTSCAGVWAAGDCTDCLYAQNNIAVGDAVKALEDIYRSLLH